MGLVRDFMRMDLDPPPVEKPKHFRYMGELKDMPSHPENPYVKLTDKRLKTLLLNTIPAVPMVFDFMSGTVNDGLTSTPVRVLIMMVRNPATRMRDAI